MSALATALPPTRNRLGRYTSTLALLTLLALAGATSFDRAWRDSFDFNHFYADARYTWQHGQLNPVLMHPDEGQRRRLPFYLPAVPLLLAPVAAFGQRPAAVLWTAGQVASLAFVLRVLWARWRRPAGDPPPHQVLLATVLAAPVVWEAAKFNQLTLPILALILAAGISLERGRDWPAGAWLGLAAVVKLLPALFVIWLALKRRWRALGGLLIVAAAIALLPPLLVFGPQQTVLYHRQWWDHNVHGAPAEGMREDGLEGHFLDRRNQALPTVLARLFAPDHPYRVRYQPVQLSEASCVWLAQGVLGLLALALAGWTARPWRALAEADRRAELAAYLLAMTALAPLVRTYYLAWALPTVWLLVERTTDPGRGRRLGLAGVSVWVAGLLAWTWRPARVCGAQWLMLVLLGILVLALRQGRSAPPGAGVRAPPGRVPPGRAALGGSSAGPVQSASRL